MKKFAFSLQKLLNLREFKEKESEIFLGKAISAREALQINLDQVAKDRHGASFERGASSRLEDLFAIERYITRLDARKEELIEEIVIAELALEKARAAYIDAHRNRQVITKLKERKEQDWRKEVLSEEAAALDDIVSAKKY